jgi:hypothetical protein
MNNLNLIKKDINKYISLKKKKKRYNILTKIYFIGKFFKKKHIKIKNDLDFIEKKINTIYLKNKKTKNDNNIKFHIKLPPKVPSPKKFKNKSLKLNISEIHGFNNIIKIITPKSTSSLSSNSSDSSYITNISISSEELIIENEIITNEDIYDKIITRENNYVCVTNPLFLNKKYNNYVNSNNT